MGLFAIISRDRSEKADVPSDPRALALGERHGSERNDYLDSSPATGRTETWEAMEKRQDAEVSVTTLGMSELEASEFRTAYLGRCCELAEQRKQAAEAELAAVESHTAEEFPELHRRLETAKEYLKSIESGEPVPDWARDAYGKGVLDGQLRTVAIMGGSTDIWDSQGAATTAWINSLPAELQSGSSFLHTAGGFKGEDEASSEIADTDFAEQSALWSTTSIWDQRLQAISFLAGDLGVGTGHLLASGKIHVPGASDQAFAMAAVKSVELATQESVKRIGKSLGWGLAGAAVFGPAGLVAGALVSGNETNVTFICILKDGKRFLASSTSGVYKHFLAATFA